MRLDKKVSGGEIKFVLAKKIGRVVWGQQVSEARIGKCWTKLAGVNHNSSGGFLIPKIFQQPA